MLILLDLFTYFSTFIDSQIVTRLSSDGLMVCNTSGTGTVSYPDLIHPDHPVTLLLVPESEIWNS